MKKIINYIAEMHQNDPECIPLAIGLLVMGIIGFFTFINIVLS